MTCIAGHRARFAVSLRSTGSTRSQALHAGGWFKRFAFLS
ncbi:hypothetical protein P355_0390 [Burkholderia cenocepacia KC-01]|nr:hypothetical protein P355_0390 [Burkholderia cenocepacia KC-01]